MLSWRKPPTEDGAGPTVSRLASALGIFVILMGFLVAISPETLVTFLVASSPSMQYYAGAARLCIGLVLFLAAPASRYPGVMMVMGAITFIAGFFLMVVSPELWQWMIGWVVEQDPTIPVYRFLVAGVAILLGGFIVYATWPRAASDEKP